MSLQETRAKLQFSLAAFGLPEECLLPPKCCGPQAVGISDLGRSKQPVETMSDHYLNL